MAVKPLHPKYSNERPDNPDTVAKPSACKGLKKKKKDPRTIRTVIKINSIY